MAYVAFSQTLKNEVEGIIDNMSDREIAALGVNNAIIKARQDAEVCARVYDLLWGDLIDLRDRLSPYDMQRRVDVRFNFSEDNIEYGSYELVFDNMKVPAHVYAKSTGSFYIQRNDLAMPLMQLSAVQEFMALQLEVFKARRRWGKVKEDITKFMGSCKSLNEALKLYPDFARYVPKSYIDKANAKTEAAKKKESAALEALRSIDLENIQTSTVLARMAGGAE